MLCIKPFKYVFIHHRNPGQAASDLAKAAQPFHHEIAPYLGNIVFGNALAQILNIPQVVIARCNFFFEFNCDLSPYIPFLLLFSLKLFSVILYVWVCACVCVCVCRVLLQLLKSALGLEKISYKYSFVWVVHCIYIFIYIQINQQTSHDIESNRNTYTANRQKDRD